MFSVSQAALFLWHHCVTLHGPRPFPPLGCARRERMLHAVIFFFSSPLPSALHGGKGETGLILLLCEYKDGELAAIVHHCYFPQELTFLLCDGAVV